ncbi:MAG: UDP-glucose/GDP-mannose dehydrogenase family protein [Cyanobacteria bacterium]|nr:UDP-glucose/GDP-mannose dehydrogenase family protein [Cyanobacteriota bacterium]
MKLAVIGTGYVGTVTGTCLAELGHDVICADVNEARIEKLQQGEMPFFEAGLEPLIRYNVQEGRLRFTTDIKEAVAESEVVFLCIGTKGTGSEAKPDLKPLMKAVKDIAGAMGPDRYRLIVEKSTLPIKTGEWLKDLLTAEAPKGADFDIAAVPQFMREGNAIWDFLHPDRIVIGAENQRAIDILVSIYGTLNAPLLVTDINSAELIKHAANAFLAMKISFINSVAQICEKTGADIAKVAKGLGMDKRISPDYLNAGLGYGGIFLPKDISSLVNIADEYHINLDLLKATEVINRYQRIRFMERIEQAVEGKDLHGKTIAVWGLAFRPNTDDMRDAPSINIIRGLQKRGVKKIRAFDPLAMKATREIMPDITYCNSVYEAAEGADVIAILTEWPDFQYINFTELKQISACRVIVDGRNLYNPIRMAKLGYHYWSIGRQKHSPEAYLNPETPGDSAPPKTKKAMAKA